MEAKNLPAILRPPVPESGERRELIPPPGSRPGTAASAPSTPTILTTPPNFWSLLAAFRRRWKLATFLGLLTGAVAALATWFLVDASSFTATAKLDIDAHKPKILFDTLGENTNFDTYRQRQMTTVKDRMLLNSALRDPKVARLDIVREQADPIEWLGKQLQVDFESTEILRISMTGKDSASIVALVDAVREAYMREHVDMERRSVEARYAQVQKLYDQYETALETHKKRIETLADKAKTKDTSLLGAIQKLAQDEIGAVTRELTEVTSKIRAARSRLDSPEEREEKKKNIVVKEEDVKDLIRKDRGYLDIQKEIAEYDHRLEGYTKASPNPEAVPAYVTLKKTRDEAVARLDAYEKKLAPVITEEMRKRRLSELERQWGYDDAELAKLKKLDTELKEVLKERDEKFNAIGTSTLGLQKALEEKAQLEPFRIAAAKEGEALKVESQAPPRIRRRGETYAVKRDPVAIRYASGAGGLGFLLIVFLVSLAEFRVRRVSDPTDVSEGLRLPVVGTMPLIRSKAGRSTTAGKDNPAAWDQILIESVDTARHLLLHLARQKQCRIVLVTSAVAGEGKTTLSAHLAASLARAGWRALLIDGDLRRPSLHTIFGLDAQPGLSEALRGDLDVRETVQAGPTGGLWVIPAGQCDTMTMQALARGSLKALFNQIRLEYDLVIVDSAPILPVVDSQIFARDADGILLSVLRNVSQLPQLFKAYQRLNLFQADLIGAVIHGAATESYATQYPYFPARPVTAGTDNPKE